MLDWKQIRGGSQIRYDGSILVLDDFTIYCNVYNNECMVAIRLVEPRSHRILSYFLLITAQNQKHAVSLCIYSSSANCRSIPYSTRGTAIVNMLIFRFKSLAKCSEEEACSKKQACFALPSSYLVPYPFAIPETDSTR